MSVSIAIWIILFSVKITLRAISNEAKKYQILLCVLLSALIMTIWLAVQPVSNLEKQIFDAIYRLPDSLKPFFIITTQAGNILIVLIFAAVLYFANKRHIATVVALYSITAFAAAYLLKIIVMRPRPELLFGETLSRYGHSTGYGFPSAHVAIVVACAFALVPFITPKYRWLIFVGAGIVCLSRIYLGAHAPLDIVGGIIIGVVIGLLAWLVTKITALKGHKDYASK